MKMAAPYQLRSGSPGLFRADLFFGPVRDRALSFQ
jgi:hypothetical protein